MDVRDYVFELRAAEHGHFHNSYQKRKDHGYPVGPFTARCGCGWVFQDDDVGYLNWDRAYTYWKDHVVTSVWTPPEDT